MSKVDAMRALKQARLEQLRAAAPARPVAAPPATARAVTAPLAAVPAAPVAAEGACGHRNMSGRSCTRASGHSEKSHRYG